MENVQNKSGNRILKTAVLIILDVVLSCAAAFCALYFRVEIEGSAMSVWKDSISTALPYSALFTVLCLFVFGAYKTRWEYAGVRDFSMIAAALALGSLINIVSFYFLDIHLPRSHFILYVFFGFLYIAGARVIYVVAKRKGQKKRNLKRTMIVGAGTAGAMVLRDLQTSSYSENKVVCFIDDNPSLRGTKINGIEVVGGDDYLSEAVKKYRIDEVLVAIPSLNDGQRTRIFTNVEATGKPVKVLPSLSQFANDQAAAGQLRDIEIEDLLPRKTVNIDLHEVKNTFNGKVILVTGGGGSIGSELCRQLAGFSPKKLIIFDIYENNAYEISQELIRTYPKLEIVTLIGSVRDLTRLRGVFEEYKPEYVFHAAAHKHVPLMEDSPNEAIKNNVMGTYNVAQVCIENNVKRMLLVSTDKAVNPTNVMGASKRMCEMVVQMMSRKKSETDFVAVRFGNVLGSNGSVIPLFKNQIASGGPVTVTDKNIIRYFMTIPEAVSLILEAGTFAYGGEIFVLDMGEPVRIDDLARRMIRLSGHTPDVDIKIEYTGLRPGEKLYEELLMDEEGMRKTENNLIYIGNPIVFDDDEFMNELSMLEKAMKDEKSDIRPLIKKVVPTYKYFAAEE